METDKKRYLKVNDYKQNDGA